MTDASCEVMKLLHMYKFWKKKKLKIQTSNLVVIVVLWNWTYIPKYLIFKYEGHFVKTINCALTLCANNNKHTKTKPDLNSKTKIYKQYSHQHLIKQLCTSHSASKTLLCSRNRDWNHMNTKIIYASKNKPNAHVAQLNSKSKILHVCI